MGDMITRWQGMVMSAPHKATATGNNLSLAIAAPKIERLVVNIQPVQGGSGTPSPSNVRSISGHSTVNVTIGADRRAMNLGGTYYGGTLDLLTGVLTVTLAAVDMGTLTYERESNAYARYIAELPQTAVSGTRTGYCLCECYETLTAGQSISTSTDKKAYLASARLYVHEHSISTAAAFKASVSGRLFVYRLATPQTYQLDPQTIRALTGRQTVSTDAGSIDITYYTV